MGQLSDANYWVDWYTWTIFGYIFIQRKSSWNKWLEKDINTKGKKEGKMENEREEDYIVGVVRIIRGLYVSGTMEFYVQGITYCFLIFFFFLIYCQPPLLPQLWIWEALYNFLSFHLGLGSRGYSDLPCSRRRQWHPSPVLLPGKSHGQRSLVGCRPWGCEELDTTERLHFHLSLSCIGEGNGNPLQCSCLENPRDGGAWWAAVYGVAESDTTEVT